jgi:GT2 family glycosyltransferase
MDVASKIRRVRGFVEARGPDRIAGWAWRSGDRPLIVCFSLDGELLGEMRADRPRPGLARVGFGDGRVGFDWAIPRREPSIEPSEVRVTEKVSGEALADKPGLKPLSRSAIKGQVEVRSAGVISGWAAGPDGPVTLHFMLGRRRLGSCVADGPRPEPAGPGAGEGGAGFTWRMPPDERIDPAAIRVKEAATGALLADRPGLTPVNRAAIKGQVEVREADVISGWAVGPEGPLTLHLMLGRRRLGSCVADDPRSELFEAGPADRRGGFTWRAPPGERIDPAAVRVMEPATGAVLADRPGLRPLGRAAIKGYVEVREAGLISGWAVGPEGPVTLRLMLGARRLGSCVSDGPRPELAEAGLGDGRGGFAWRIPPSERIDPAAIQVAEAATGAVLPDVPGLAPVQPPPVWGHVERRGPEVIAGWAWDASGPLTLSLVRRGEVLGRCVADLARPALAELGFGDGRASFEWRLPFVDPAIVPEEVEVRVEPDGERLPDAPGLRPTATPALRGMVEARGPEAISGWAWAAGGPGRLVFMRGDERLGHCIADQPRPSLGALGVGDGRVGFSWRLPFLDPPLNPKEVEVRSEAGGEPLPDASGLAVVMPSVVRGPVEARGPSAISGWAKGPGGPVDLEFLRDGEVLGQCTADLYRPGFEEAGLGDGNAGFEWIIPPADRTVDPAEVEVRAARTADPLPDVDGLTPIRPPAVRGAVETRGPELIAGWARGGDGFVELVLSRGGEALGRVRADQLRQALAGRPGFGDGRVGFTWRLPLTDPPFDPTGVEVRAAEGGELLLDAEGVAAVVAQPIRGMVEVRGPHAIAGWARGAGGPLRLNFLLDGERLGGCTADQFRQDLADTGVADGRAAFRWRLPFMDPPVDPARIEVRDCASGWLIADAPGVRAITPPPVRGWVEARGPDAISGWAHGAGGPLTLRIMLDQEVLAEVRADRFRESLQRDGIGDGRAGFEWALPFVHPPIDPGRVKVVEAERGVEIADAAGVKPVRPPPLRGLVEEASYRLVSGWAWDGRPGERLGIEILQDGAVIGSCRADRPRSDLKQSGFDDGRHGFAWIPPRRLRRFDADRVQVRVQPGGAILPLKPPAPRPAGLALSDRRIEAGWLKARLSCAGEAEPPSALDLVSDGHFLLRADISDLAFDAEGRAELEIELPRQLYDGQPHRLALHEPREGWRLGGQDEPLVLRSSFNSMVELLTPREIRGWVIDPDDAKGEGEVELREGGRLIRRARYSRERPEVAKAMGAAHAWEFAIRRLPLGLFDGRQHLLSLTSAGRLLFPHRQSHLAVCWTEADAAEGAERFEGAVQEINPLSLKGYAVDHLSDRPVEIEVRVDGEVVARHMADRYVAALKDQAGHGFHGFDFPLPTSLMNGRRRRLEVGPAGTGYALPPGRRLLTFPLVAVGEPLPPLDPPQLPRARARASDEPALLSLIMLNLNGAHVLEPMLASLAATRFRDRLEIILIDHGSTDDSAAIIEAWRGRLRLIPVYRGGNHSFSASNNLGAVLARGEHLVFVNNDIVFTGDALAGMRDILDASPEVGLVGLRLLEPRYRGEGRWERATHHTGVRFRTRVSQDKTLPRLYHPVEVEDGGEQGAVIEPAATAALAMMRKADFRAVGGFDEAYHYGYEDVDLALRLRGQLGKVAVCRLDATAVHNRSATREAKLVHSGQPKPEALSLRDAHANLDIFTRRFSRHLPRLILRQLVRGGEAWRSAPLRIAFVVSDTEAGPESEAARALGAELRDRFGWEPMLLAEDVRELTRTDVLVSLRPGYELRRVTDASPGLVTVAWPLLGAGAWEGRDQPYQLRLDPPAARAQPAPAQAARALRQRLLDLLEGPRRRVAIKAQAENEPHAHALAEAFAAAGHCVRLDGPRHWMEGLSACDELVVAMAGLRAYRPFAGAVNALCLAPGGERPDAHALAAFDHLFEAGDPEADARSLIERLESLRGEFLGGLA